MLEQLQEHFGIEKVPYLLFKTGKEKIRGFSGHLSREELQAFFDTVVVEIVGLYLAKEDKREEFRLGLDGVHLLQGTLQKGFFDLNDEQAQRWLKGEDLEVDSSLHGFYIARNKEDLLGCGRATQGRFINFIPKERRIR